MTYLFSMEVKRLDALLQLQSHRDITPSMDAVIDCFSATWLRRLHFNLKFNTQQTVYVSPYMVVDTLDTAKQI